MFLPNDFKYTTGVPFSSSLTFSPSLYPHIPTFNEGDSVAVASGTWLAGENTLVYLQSSGIGNLLNPLTSWVIPARIPLFMLLSPRGGQKDTEPHRLDPPQIDFLNNLPGIKPFTLTNENTSELSLVWADSARNRECLATLLSAEPPPQTAFPPCEPSPKKNPSPQSVQDWNISRHSSRERMAFLEDLLPFFNEKDIKVATTGYTSRELFVLGDSPSNLYCQGAMGCASLIGLGISRASRRRVVVLDGDGALLMRPSALASIGLCNDQDLWHFVLDNGSYASTGGQSTHSSQFDLSAVALSFGYQVAVQTTGYDSSLDSYLKTFQGPKFIRVYVNSSLGKAPRAPLSLSENSSRLREFLKSLSHS
jgi:phosphonopyruvate decarboxylase